MEANQAFRCPACLCEKYTSLPFGNVIGVTGSASTYRCLRCNVYFSAGVPVLHRKMPRSPSYAGFDDGFSEPVTRANVEYSQLGSLV